MAIEGTYKVELTTTLGNENIILTLDTFGDSLNGYMEGFFGQQSFVDGTIDGNNVSFSLEAESPVGRLEIDVTATIEGDEIVGQVQIGAFRPSQFRGIRVQ